MDSVGEPARKHVLAVPQVADERFGRADNVVPEDGPRLSPGAASRIQRPIFVGVHEQQGDEADANDVVALIAQDRVLFDDGYGGDDHERSHETRVPAEDVHQGEDHDAEIKQSERQTAHIVEEFDRREFTEVARRLCPDRSRAEHEAAHPEVGDQQAEHR